MAVRDYFSPKVKDWWASRSKASLRKRIETLTKQLRDHGGRLYIRGFSETLRQTSVSRNMNALNWYGFSVMLLVCAPSIYRRMAVASSTDRADWMAFWVVSSMALLSALANLREGIRARRDRNYNRMFTEKRHKQLHEEILSLIRKLEAKGGDVKGLLPDPPSGTFP